MLLLKCTQGERGCQIFDLLKGTYFMDGPFVDDINKTVQKNHCHSISFLDLLSLEVNLTKDELGRIR